MILRQTPRSTSSKLRNASKRKALLTSTSTPPKASSAAAISRGARLGIGDVRGYRDGPGAGILHLGQHLVERRLPACRQNEVGAVRRQRRAAWRPRPGPTPDTTHTLPDKSPAPGTDSVSFLAEVMRCSVGQDGAVTHPRHRQPGLE